MSESQPKIETSEGLSELELSVLNLLSTEITASELAAKLNQEFSISLTEEQLYPILTKLHGHDGFVKRRIVDRKTSKQRLLFSLTPKGENFLSR